VGDGGRKEGRMTGEKEEIRLYLHEPFIYCCNMYYDITEITIHTIHY
jgi:hypothetical protein